MSSATISNDCLFPPSGKFIESVKRSSRELRLSSGIEIHDEGIRRLLLSESFTGTFDKLKTAHGVNFPLNFPNVIAQLNLISVLALVNFGSGYRIPLHEHAQRGAYDTIRTLLLSLYLSSPSQTSASPNNYLSSKGLKSLTIADISSHTGLPVHIDKPHPTIPGLTIGEQGGPLFELLSLLTRTLNETGEILDGESMRFPDLGSFVLKSLENAEREGKKGGTGVDVNSLLESLVRAIPAFRDMAIVDGKREPLISAIGGLVTYGDVLRRSAVYIFKKALFLIQAINLRFSSTEPPPIPIPEVKELPVFADNVVPSMLVHLGILDLSSAHALALRNAFGDDVQSRVDSLLQGVSEVGPPSKKTTTPDLANLEEGPRLSVTDGFRLRAAAVDACESIVLYARNRLEIPLGKEKELEWLKDITVPELDGWLWSVAKDRSDYRALPRFVETGTLYF